MTQDDVTAPSGWAAQQLAECLAVLTVAADDAAAVSGALERIAESFEADAGAFLRHGRVIESLGWASGCTPEAEVVTAANGDGAGLELPGVGWCETVAIPVDVEKGTTLFLARAGHRFTPQELGLLRGMGRVLSLGLRLLDTAAIERRQAQQNRALVDSLRDRQALLETLARIQRQIASRAALQDVMDAITAAAAELLDVERVALRLVDEFDSTVMVTTSSVGGGCTELVNTTLHTGPRPPGAGAAAAADPVWTAATDPDREGKPGEYAEEGLPLVMAVYIHLDDVPTGTLIVGSPRGGRTYTRTDRDILTTLAEHASLALNDARTVQAMNKALEDATHQAMHDELTGLPNRACLYDRLEQALRQAGRDGTCTAVLLFDLDRFKEINDTLGHKYGDRILAEVGPRIRQGLREADTLARLGGDEFCVLLPSVDGLGAALQVAERIVSSFEVPFEIDGMTLAVDASCGIASAPVDGDNADVLLQRADVAMYVAKDSHANVVTYNDELNVNTPARLALLGELRTAIAGDQLVLHYQPKAALDSGHIEGVEALVRWQHPTLGLVPPDQFIPLAEHTGLIKPLTTWVLNTALRQLQQWQEQTDPPFPAELSMALNVSTRSLLDDAFPAEVVAALDRWNVAPHLLELEITESAIIADPVRAHSLLTQLAAAGIKIAIDDFGTGYSSLAYLKNLPVDQLKIDRSFVLHMHDDPNDAIIVRSVIDLGHNLGLLTVAEGIEDVETWDQLASLGCDSAQGYFLARPMPAEEVGAWLQAAATSTSRPPATVRAAS